MLDACATHSFLGYHHATVKAATDFAGKLLRPARRCKQNAIFGKCNLFNLEANPSTSKTKPLFQDSSAYEDWRHWRLPNLLEVLEEFPSCKPSASLLIAHLMPLQPRFYSISSCPQRQPDEIHLTVAVVRYRSEDGKGVEHFGVCSNYLDGLKENDDIYFFVRK